MKSFSSILIFVAFTVLFFINWDIEEKIISYTINPKEQNLQFYLKDSTDRNYYNFSRLKQNLTAKNEQLVFAMNGGMYKKDGSPQGLYIENCITVSPIEKRIDGYGNFYLQSLLLPLSNLLLILNTLRNLALCYSSMRIFIQD